MADRLDKAIDFHRQQTNVDTRIGYTGDGTGSGDPRVRDNSGRMYVRFQLAGRYTLPVPFPLDTNANVPVADNIPVEVGYIGGEKTILRVYRRGYLQSGSNPASTNPSDPQVTITNTSDITQFQCKRSLDSSKPLYVVVLQGYIEISGVAHVFLSDEIDLSSFVPATGERCIACVYLKDDLTLEAFASTPKLITDAITEEDIDECRQQAASTSMSIWGWFLDGDITTLDEDPSKNIDLRPFFNSPTSGGSVDATAIHTDGANEISGLTEKVTPANDDLVVIEDSAASYVKKKVKMSNISGGGSTTFTDDELREMIWLGVV